ncbi:MAG TPA: type VI secretion system membrane subunit TssM [Pyrinomonadaceae bacterium]|nr:type VI secretion system membrane subunit TssM [Pyrinomonadaceae bacterium]
MSWHTYQLKYALGFGGVMSVYGIFTMLTYLVPYPRLGYTERTIIVIAFVLITLPFVLLIAFVSSRRRKKREKKEAEAAGLSQSSESTESNGTAPKLTSPAGSYSDLATSTEEAVQFLKTSNLGATGRDAIYGLPWYLVAGPPKAGKSSLVISSNLNFQTLPSQRQSEQAFVRPTAGVDWRVTSEAVFIDSAGRYQTEGIDADEWSGLLETIKKYRSNRPLDGLILVFDADRILKADEREIEEMAKVQRARLDEVTQRLKVRFPVYVVFSHADAIEGFRDSFSTSKSEDRTLVWGATIPIEKSENAQALFDGEYETLHNSVMKRRVVRLSAPFPPVRQLRIFNFPLHFGSGRKKFGAFINALFRPNPFSENPFLRGFYFTAAPAGKAGADGQQSVAGSYFTQRFFRDVVLRDKDLVTTFIAQRQKAPIFGWFLTFLAGLIVLILLTMAGISLVTNNQMLNQAEVLGDKVLTIVKADNGKNPLDKREDEAKREINTTEEMRDLLLSKLDTYEREGAPIYMRFGMYSGNQVYKKSLLPMYFSVIEQRYKKPTVKRLEVELRKFADSNPVANTAQLTEKEEQNLSRHYDLLKAYMMLSGEYKAKAESSHIAAALKDFWVTESKVPPDMKLIAIAQLDFWAKQVDRDDEDVKFPRINLDGKLVDDTRKKLQAFPAVYRYYSRKVTEISKTVDDNVGKTTAEAILTRNGADTSFIEGSYAVPSAFTRPGFDLMKVAITEADKKLSEDDWVMGELGKKEVAKSTDATLLQDRYYRDYADNWRNFVKNTHVKPYKNKDDATQALLAFSTANSPMKILMREVAKNTNLSAKPENQGWIDWAISYVFPPKTSETGGSQPEKEFRPLFTFMGTKEQADNANVEKYRNEIGNVYKSFNGISADKLKEIAAAMAKDDDPLKIRQRETAITNLLSSFNETPSSQDVSLLLQEPLGNLRALLGADIKTQIAKTWTQEVLPSASEIEKGYPFEDGQAESDLTKLSAFLNPNDGKFSKFYKDRLEKYFEEADGKLKLKDTAEVQFTDEFIAYLNNAVALRKALFGANATPKFEYEFGLKGGKDALIEVMIDGQKIDSSGTGSLKGTFPAGGSAQTGVSITQGSPGTTTTSGSSNSNTAAPAPSGPDQRNFPGAWGLFRFVDAGKPQKQAGGEYQMTYSIVGKSLTATIKPSGGDPFDKSLFRNLKAPPTILK